jgi:hypothetical protein
MAARAVLILSTVIGIWAVSDFSYNAYILTDILQRRSDIVQPRSGYPFATSQPYPVSDPVVYHNDLMQRDAIAALMAVVLLIGSTVISRRMKRGHSRRG